MNWIQKVINSFGLDKGLAFVTIGNLVSAGLGALLWFILASQMTAESYGSLNYYISIATILTAVGILGFDSTLTTFVAKGLSKMISEAGSLVLLTGIALAVAISLALGSISVGLILIGMLFFTLSTAEILGRRLYKEFMIVMISQRVVTLIAVPFLFIFYGVDGALYGYAISYLPLSYRFFLSLRQLNFSLSTLRPNKKFFLNSYAFGISRTLVHFSDKLIILPFFGLALLGYYQFGLQMLTVVSIIPTIVYNYLLPQEASNSRNSSKLQVLGVFVSVAIVAILIGSTPMIVTNLFPQFWNAITSTQVVLIAGIPLTIVSIYSSKLLAREKSLHVSISSGLFLGVQYGLLMSLGSLIGLVGLSLATVLAAVSQAAFLSLAFGRLKNPH